MSGTAAETVATLAAAAGLALSPERCEELAPLSEMLRGGLEHLRSANLEGHEPFGPGNVPDRREA